MTTSDDWVVLVSIGIISNKKEKQRETEREWREKKMVQFYLLLILFVSQAQQVGAWRRLVELIAVASADKSKSHYYYYSNY